MNLLEAILNLLIMAVHFTLKNILSCTTFLLYLCFMVYFRDGCNELIQG